MATIWEKLENTSLQEKAIIVDFCRRKIDEINFDLSTVRCVTQKVELLEEKRDFEHVIVWLNDPPTDTLQ